MNYALILAGGSGTRLGGDTPKQFLDLAGRPVIAWSMKAFNGQADIDGIVVACPEPYREQVREIAAAHGVTKLLEVVAGGDTRQLSAYRALTARDFAADDIVLLHDAARPFVASEVIRNCIHAAAAFGAASAYVKVTDTIAEAWDGFVAAIPDRSSLYHTQTPQSFRYGIIRQSHERALAERSVDSTDDVSLVMNAGTRVRVVEGDYRNIKITNPRDLEIAERTAANWTEAAP